MKSRRSKECDITFKVKKLVWERDCHMCIICGNPQAMPNAHYIPRSRGGLGIEKNIVTLCNYCHYKTDFSTQRQDMLTVIRNYLKSKYNDWNEEDLTYKK